MTVHQVAKFSTNLKACHGTAVKIIGKRLLGTSDEGLEHEPNLDKVLEEFVDAGFAGGFNATKAEYPALACSRTGFVIKCAGCPIIWKSKLQTEIALSTAEAEHAALSTALRETMIITHFLKEIGAMMDVPSCDKIIKCTMFEDNNGAVELAKAPKTRPHAKYIAIKYHHFRPCVQKGEIIIERLMQQNKKLILSQSY